MCIGLHGADKSTNMGRGEVSVMEPPPFSVLTTQPDLHSTSLSVRVRGLLTVRVGMCKNLP